MAAPAAAAAHAPVSTRSRGERVTGAPMASAGTISVVVTTHNRAALVQETLASVFAQTRAPLEVIVVDDGSTDDTSERLAPIAAAGRIRYVRQANAGLAAARNHGASLARGDYLAFIDDDDLWPTDVLAWTAEHLDADPTLGLVLGTHTEFGEVDAGGVPEPPMSDAATSRPPWLGVFTGCPATSVGQVLMRRSVFETAGGFRGEFWSVEDWDLWLRLFRDAPVLRVRRTALHYRVHGAGMSKKIARHVEAMLRLFDDHLPRVPAAQRPLLRYLTYDNLVGSFGPRVHRRLREAVRAGDWAAAGEALRLTLRLQTRLLRAALGVKGRLLLRGRWRLDHADPVVRAAYPNRGGADVR